MISLCTTIVYSLMSMSNDAITSLRGNERFLQHVLQIARLGTYVMDIPSGLFTSSDILDEIFGLPPDYPRSFAGWVSLLHPDDRKMMADYFAEEVVGKRQRFDKEYRIIRVVDGQERWIHGYGELGLDADNNPLTMTGTIQDITDRKTVESELLNITAVLARRVSERTEELEKANSTLKDSIQQLRKSQMLLNEMGVMAQVGGWELDIHTGKQVWTEEVYRIHELDLDYEPTADKGISFYAPAARPVIECAVKQCMEEGVPFDLELEFITAKGNRRWVRAIGKADSGHDRIHGTFQDVTDRRMGDEALREKNVALDLTVAQLRKLAMELTLAEDRERKRLAEILHDHVQQYIAAARMKVSLLDSRMSPSDHDQGVKAILDLLGEALDASRSLTMSLYPPVLLDAGLMPGLRWLAEWMGNKHGLTVSVSGDDALSVPGPLSILLFQAVRECLFNVVKHAAVNEAFVVLDQPDAGSLRVVVEDQGRGFSRGEGRYAFPLEGFGLFHLRERLAHIGGALEVTSEPGRGTRVSMMVPYPESASEKP